MRDNEDTMTPEKKAKLHFNVTPHLIPVNLFMGWKIIHNWPSLKLLLTEHVLCAPVFTKGTFDHPS